PVRADPASPQQDPPVVLAGAARGRDRDGPRRAREGFPQGWPPGPEAGALVGAGARRRGDELRRPRCAVCRGRRRARVAVAGLAAQAHRVIDVDWDHDQPATYVVSVEVEALDRSRLLRDVAQALAEHHVNILSCTSQTSSDRVAKLRFDFELADPSHLESIL